MKYEYLHFFNFIIYFSVLGNMYTRDLQTILKCTILSIFIPNIIKRL